MEHNWTPLASTQNHGRFGGDPEGRAEDGPGPMPGAVTDFPNSLPYSPWLQMSPDPLRGGSGSSEPAAGSSSSNAGAMAFHAVMSRATT